MSVGVNATFKLLEVAARMLSSGYDIEIHRGTPSPQGRRALGHRAEDGRGHRRAHGRRLEELAVYAREGHTGERRTGSIGFAAMRGGDIVGDHTVMFAGIGERIEITHRSTSRMALCERAACAPRASSPKPRRGLYDMADVLGL